jgi:type III restriction enzyme
VVADGGGAGAETTDREGGCSGVTETAPETELIDEDRIAAVAASLDLRDPNRRALRSIADALAYHYDVAGEEDTFEGVVDSATGVGKTFILAAAIEYFAARGHRNFAVITPGRTILNKTEANFTPGHVKSLLDGMEVRPVVVTSESFDSPKVAAALDDSEKVKLFIFTVQSLTAPANDKAHRRAHEFQEGLGEAFYDHLASLSDLMIFADEHHCYYGPSFSNAIRNLKPYALIGLTATPHKDTPEEQLIFRYPLAAAIAEKLVKTPVIVGRKDDRDDIETKLQDGIRLLETKKTLVDLYVLANGVEAVNPVMLVVAPSIDEAHEVEAIVKRSDFLDGRYADHVLTVTSREKDKERTLELLGEIEDPASKVRILVSVGMLKEGWDVKNVYVICSLRPSISDILTEQTLGRGLRLPFGRYTGEQLLDTLEVVAHEKYEKLLKKADVINEAFIDIETRTALRGNGSAISIEKETETVETPVEVETEGGTEGGSAGPLITDNETREAEAATEASAERVVLAPRKGVPPLFIPVLEMLPVESKFSLNDITNLDPFKKLGEKIAQDPEDELRRELLSAEIRVGADGLREAVFTTETADEAVKSAPTVIPLDDAKKQLVGLILASPVVPARPAEQKAAERLVGEFVKGIGVDAPSVLSRYLGRAGARLVKLINSEYKKVMAKPTYQEVVEVREFTPTRVGRPTTSRSRKAKFKRNVGYTGWSKRSIFNQVWFDSGTELALANVLDGSAEIEHWLRLHRDDLPILWSSGGSWYHPDFIAIDTDGVHWIVEAKSNRDLESEDVQAKREAAQRWANHVSADEQVNVEWCYLLASEDDVDSAKGDWTALKSLATT